MTENATTILPSTQTASSARAVEVVSMMGDSVVDVAHVEPLSKPRSRRTAFVLFGAAAILLAVATFAFAKGVHIAALNEEALHQWTFVQERPIHEFRPQRLGAAYDWMAFGGLAGGILALGFGLFRLRTRAARSSFAIGSSEEADVCTNHAPATVFPLVSQRGDKMVVSTAGAMQCELRRDGHVYSAGELMALRVARPATGFAGGIELDVPEHGTLFVTVGPMHFAIRSVAAERSRLGTLLARFDDRVGKFFALSALVHIAVLALLTTIPPAPDALTLEFGGTSPRVVRVTSVAAEDPIREPTADGAQDGSAADGAPLPGQEGMSGDRTSDKPGKTGNNRPARTSPTRATAMRDAREAGILGALRGSSGNFTTLVASTAMPGYGTYDCFGPCVAEGEGGPGFGTGVRYTGPGGGGIRAGLYATIGWPGSNGPGGPGGGPGPSITDRGHRSRGPRVTIKKPDVDGDLDRSIIRRKIKQKLARIQHCYERELMLDPALEGTVNSTFLIDGNGAVIASRASGMDHQELESCVAGVVKSIRFPSPKNGSSVKVSYPFRFRKAG